MDQATTSTAGEIRSGAGSVPRVRAISGWMHFAGSRAIAWRRHQRFSSSFWPCLLSSRPVSPYKYWEQDYSVINKSPTPSHPLGTDQLGRDMFSRLVYGARISLSVGIVVQLVIVLIGVPVGLAAGFYGGKIDTALMRLVDVLYAMPSLLFVIIIMTFLRGVLDQPGGGLMKTSPK